MPHNAFRITQALIHQGKIIKIQEKQDIWNQTGYLAPQPSSWSIGPSCWPSRQKCTDNSTNLDPHIGPLDQGAQNDIKTNPCLVPHLSLLGPEHQKGKKQSISSSEPISKLYANLVTKFLSSQQIIKH